ncbi:hypothetical protein LINGRAHAP2_LOCUS20648 [Linum grandiflorum]
MELSLFRPSLLILFIVFLSVSSHDQLAASSPAEFLAQNHPADPPDQVVDPNMLNKKKPLGPHEKFGDPFENPHDYKEKKLPNDFGTPNLTKNN